MDMCVRVLCVYVCVFVCLCVSVHVFLMCAVCIECVVLRNFVCVCVRVIDWVCMFMREGGSEGGRAAGKMHHGIVLLSWIVASTFTNSTLTDGG